ncbi:MAG TPA: MlaD family protein [Solirubrobacterales bacterium]|nr:MlaD family protein [Solirubrobacterales bacterium]
MSPRARKPRPLKAPPATEGPDERIYGRHYRGPRPWVIGLVVALLALAFTYLAFTKELPFTGAGYELEATFENAGTLRTGAPVRIAGVNVGEVTGIEAQGDAARVTFTVTDEGRPIHEDAEVKIRPRLFLEGNMFLDLRPGSPSAPELSDGGDIPISRTSIAVQLGEVLTALQRDSRRDLQLLLEGYGTALNYEPTAADDRGQDPDVHGETAGEALNDALRYGGRAGRDSAIVNQALRGEHRHDLSRLIRAQRNVFRELEPVEEQLQDLIVNFNVTVGALAAESANVSLTIDELAPTLEQAEPSLRELSDALPPLRALAIEARPGIAELPATIAATRPWLAEADPLLGDRELGGTARLLREAAPPLAETARASAPLFGNLGRVSRCTSEVLVPTGDLVINDSGVVDGTPFDFGTGQPNYREFFYSLVQMAGESQSFDGNGSYVRVQAGGGPTLVQAPNVAGSPIGQRLLFGNTIEPPLGVRPALPARRPPFRMDVPCHRNPVPNVNGPAAAVAPPDLVETAP